MNIRRITPIVNISTENSFNKKKEDEKKKATNESFKDIVNKLKNVK